MIGFFVYNLVSGRRHLAAVLRKSYICKCGCKGWCRIFPIVDMLHWPVGACAAGTWPRQHPSGRDWVDAEGGRKANGGLNLGYRAAVVYIKGDLGGVGPHPGISNLGVCSVPMPFVLVQQRESV